MTSKMCRQAVMVTVDGRSVFTRGGRASSYSLEQTEKFTEPAISVEYHNAKIWEAVKARRKASAEAQLGVEVKWVSIKPRKVDFIM